MLTKRIIPCLDIKNGRVVKGVNFIGLKDAGCPVELARQYNDQLADEIVFLDITATNESRQTMLEVVKQVAREVFIPLTVGGGIASAGDVKALLNRGADKVAINSAAVNNPQLITELAEIFGSQCIVVAIDVKKHQNEWLVYTHGGSKATGFEIRFWIDQVVRRGAGELLITSIDTDGSRNGFDLELYRLLGQTRVPIIASGGAGRLQDFADVLGLTNVSGALAASVFHYQQLSIIQLKRKLHRLGVRIRL